MNEKELAFLGKIIAGITHELKNVLATLTESKGLLEDITVHHTQTINGQKENVQRAFRVMEKHIDRGVNISSSLNQFAHMMDFLRHETDTDSVLAQVLFLTERSARQKNITLRLQKQNRNIALKTSPFYLTLTLAACVEHCFQICHPGTTLHLCSVQTGDLVNLEIVADPGTCERLQTLPKFDDALTILDARLTSITTPETEGVRLSLPQKA